MVIIQKREATRQKQGYGGFVKKKKVLNKTKWFSSENHNCLKVVV